jgi:autotransporter-associated beta strand protein
LEFVKTGAGELDLTGDNSGLVGAIAVNAGILNIQSPGGFPTSPVGEITVAGGAALEVGGGIQDNVTLNDRATLREPNNLFGEICSAITVAGTVSVQTDDGSDLEFCGPMSGSGALDKVGSGVLDLTGDDSGYLGPITIGAGRVVVTSNTGLGDPSVGTTVEAGGSLVLENSVVVAESITVTGHGDGASAALDGEDGAGTLTGFITIVGDSLVDDSSVLNPGLTISGPISGDGSLSVGRWGLTMTGTSNNSYTGGTTVDDGTLTLNKAPGVVAVPGPLTCDAFSGGNVVVAGSEQISDTATVTIFGGGNGLTLNAPETIGCLTLVDGTGVTATNGTLTLNGNIVATGGSAQYRTSSAMSPWVQRRARSQQMLD